MSSSSYNSLYLENVENKGFILVDEYFTEKGWLRVENKMNKLIYCNPNKRLERYELHVDNDKVHIVIPLKNSSYSYRTFFDNYFRASEFVISHLKHFTNK